MFYLSIRNIFTFAFKLKKKGKENQSSFNEGKSDITENYYKDGYKFIVYTYQHFMVN